MHSRTFLHVSLGILALALAYHLGARSATAQVGSPVAGLTVASVGCGAAVFVLTPNGDLYSRGYTCNGMTGSAPTYAGNFWGVPTPAVQSSFGSLKVRYRGDRDAQGVKPGDRDARP